MGEVLKEEGFAPLPRRLDEEHPSRGGPHIKAVADVREFSLAPRTFHTACGGMFLFIPDLIRLGVNKLAGVAPLGSSPDNPSTSTSTPSPTTATTIIGTSATRRILMDF